MTVSSSKRGAGGGGLTGAASTAVVVETGAGSVALEAGDGDGHCAGGGAGCADVSVLGSDADPYRAGGAGGVCVFADLVVAGVVFAVGAVALGARDAFRLRSTAGSTGTVVSVRGAFGSAAVGAAATGVAAAGDGVAEFSATDVVASVGASDLGLARSAR